MDYTLPDFEATLEDAVNRRSMLTNALFELNILDGSPQQYVKIVEKLMEMATNAPEEVQIEALMSAISLASKETVEMAEMNTTGFITKFMLGARQLWPFKHVIETLNSSMKTAEERNMMRVDYRASLDDSSVTSDETTRSQSSERRIASISTTQVAAVMQSVDQTSSIKPEPTTQEVVESINNDIAFHVTKLSVQLKESQDRLNKLPFNIHEDAIITSTLERYVTWRLIGLSDAEAAKKMKLCLKNAPARLNGRKTKLAGWIASDGSQDQLLQLILALRDTTEELGKSVTSTGDLVNIAAFVAMDAMWSKDSKEKLNKVCEICLSCGKLHSIIKPCAAMKNKCHYCHTVGHAVVICRKLAGENFIIFFILFYSTDH